MLNGVIRIGSPGATVCATDAPLRVSKPPIADD
jgi:hypothetical protein